MQSEHYLESNLILFSSFLGKVLLLTEFQAKLFWREIDRVEIRETAS